MPKRAMKSNPSKRLPVNVHHVLDLIKEDKTIQELKNTDEQIMLRVSSAESGLRHSALPGKVE